MLRHIRFIISGNASYSTVRASLSGQPAARALDPVAGFGGPKIAGSSPGKVSEQQQRKY